MHRIEDYDSERLVHLDDDSRDDQVDYLAKPLIDESSSLTHTGSAKWEIPSRWSNGCTKCTPVSLRPYLTWENVKVL